MSRSFALERIRINIEIFCESIGDFLGSSTSALKKPLLVLAGIAMVMTLRAARRGVQRMKNGGLTAGAHDPRYRATGYGSGGSMFGSSKSSSFGSTLKNAFGGGSSGSSSYGSGSSSYGSSSSPYGTSSSSPYSSSSSSSFSSSSFGNMPNGQVERALADLVDKHGNSVRVLDAQKFYDYGGSHSFYGQVETLTAFEGAGVVEKVLQSRGDGKVLVVDGSASTGSAIYGKTAAENARRNGWKGVIVNGVVYNTKAIGAIPVGVKALGAHPKRGRATTGSKGSTLNIGGQSISSGMWIYADKDGIAISDAELRLDGAPPSSSSSFSSGATPNPGTSSQPPYSSSSPGGSSSFGSSSGTPGNFNTPGGPSGSFGSNGSSGGFNQGGTGQNSQGTPNSPGGGFNSNSNGYGDSSFGGSSGYGRTPPPPGGGFGNGNGGGYGSGSYPYSHHGYSSSHSLRSASALGFAAISTLIWLVLS